eukprot:scaffold9708_cov109-Isochrysis_galbana.AAC.2
MPSEKENTPPLTWRPAAGGAASANSEISHRATSARARGDASSASSGIAGVVASRAANIGARG